MAACFRDHRDPARIEHTVQELVALRPAPQRLQPPGRVYGLALGYEDLNDHDPLRQDPLLAVLVEKADPSGGASGIRAKRWRALLSPRGIGGQARAR